MRTFWTPVLALLLSLGVIQTGFAQPVLTVDLSEPETAAPVAAPAVASAGPAPVAAADDLEGQYTLSAGDKIRVIVFGEETLTSDYVITSAGNLSFPLVGNVPAQGKTVEQLQEALKTRLGDGFLREPRVSIQVVAFRPFYILGEVARPGEYPVSTGLTVEQAVAMAGGYTYRANRKKAYLKRATEPEERMINLREGMIVRAGDTLRIRERHF